MAKRQSVTRIAAKQIARTTATRMINDKFGNGILGAFLKLGAREVIKKTDKLEHNKDLGIIY